MMMVMMMMMMMDDDGVCIYVRQGRLPSRIIK